MTITLYELSASEKPLLFSPHCWKSRLALRHKGVDFQSEPVCFTQKEKIAFSGQKLLPVLAHENNTITDSWEIAQFLEVRYPDAPSLFGNKETQATIKDIHQWANTELSRHVPPIILLDVYHMIREEDKAYFRETREARIGKTLEACCENASASLTALLDELSTLSERLDEQTFLTGEQALYGDIAVFSTILWVEISRQKKLLPADHSLYEWYQAMTSLYI